MNLFRMQINWYEVEYNVIVSHQTANKILTSYLHIFLMDIAKVFPFKRWNVFQTLEEAGCSLHLTVHLFLDMVSVSILSQGGKVHLLAVPHSRYFSPLHMKQRAIINETPPYGWPTTLSKI